MSETTEFHEVVIVGTGFAGLGQALALARAGVDDVVLLEKAPASRGSAAPGATTPTPAAPATSRRTCTRSPATSTRTGLGRTRRSRRSATIWNACADQHDLRRHVRFSTEMTGASWDEESRTWTVHTDRGDAPRRFLVSGGRRPAPPARPRPSPAPSASAARRSTRRGGATTSTCAASGSRSSAPGRARSSSSRRSHRSPRGVTLFQRTPPWVLPKGDHPIGALRQKLFARVPAVARAYRGALYAALESRAVGLHEPPGAAAPGRVARPQAHRARDLRPGAASRSSRRATRWAASACCSRTTTTRRSPARTSRSWTRASPRSPRPAWSTATASSTRST